MPRARIEGRIFPMTVPASTGKLQRRIGRKIGDARVRAGPRPRHAWETLSDDQLLSLRFRDLRLTIAGTDLEQAVERLYGELATRGIRFRPHCWLSQEW